MDIPQGLRKFRATDREECGLIIEARDRTYVVKIPNRAERDDDYVIVLSDVRNVRKVLSPDEKIIGFIHTHLPHHSCDPTDADFSGAELFPGMNNLIYKPNTGETQWYGAVGEVATTST